MYTLKFENMPISLHATYEAAAAHLEDCVSEAASESVEADETQYDIIFEHRYAVHRWLEDHEVTAALGEIRGERLLETDSLDEADKLRDELAAEHGADYALVWDRETRTIR